MSQPNPRPTSSSPAAAPAAESSTGELRDADGLLIDAYSDASLDSRNELDALSVPSSLVNDELLDSLDDDRDPLEAVDPAPDGDPVDTIDSGARQASADEGEMGLGAEPHSAEELELAALGDALAGAAGVTRDEQVHGARLFDDPEEAAAEEANA